MVYVGNMRTGEEHGAVFMDPRSKVTKEASGLPTGCGGLSIFTIFRTKRGGGQDRPAPPNVHLKECVGRSQEFPLLSKDTTHIFADMTPYTFGQLLEKCGEKVTVDSLKSLLEHFKSDSGLSHLVDELKCVIRKRETSEKFA